NIPIPMNEHRNPKDLIPPFHELQEPSIELVVSGLLSTIARENIRYVGLLATDVRDRIFLAREIRRHCPDTVLFTFSADLLYLHTDSGLDFHGMLVVSPYPLLNMNQLWTDPSRGVRSRVQFPTYTAQGIYNATLALLAIGKKNKEREDIEDKM